jgi:hypothetical protein
VKEVTTEIFSSKAMAAPSRRDSTVHRLCTIKWNKAIEVVLLPTWTNKLGKVYYKLDYEVEMRYDDGTADFTVYHNGKKVGGQNVAVKFD